MNRYQCIATLVEREALRYTPAGIAIVTARLQHSSQQIEAGVARTVEFDMPALAAGDISTRLLALALGQSCRFTGFLARRSRNSRTLVLHITDFDSDI